MLGNCHLPSAIVCRVFKKKSQNFIVDVFGKGSKLRHCKVRNNQANHGYIYIIFLTEHYRMFKWTTLFTRLFSSLTSIWSIKWKIFFFQDPGSFIIMGIYLVLLNETHDL